MICKLNPNYIIYRDGRMVSKHTGKYLSIDFSSRCPSYRLWSDNVTKRYSVRKLIDFHFSGKYKTYNQVPNSTSTSKIKQEQLKVVKLLLKTHNLKQIGDLYNVSSMSVHRFLKRNKLK